MRPFPLMRRHQILLDLNEPDAELLLHHWPDWARPEQLAPGGKWRIWLFFGGRGSGKTRAGAEWVAEGVRQKRMKRIAIMGATFQDARGVMIEGESGLIKASPEAEFQPSNRRVKWANGAIADVISAEEPDYVRGRQFDAVWADEFCKWSDPQAGLDMVLMALRLGRKPKMLITTTPRNIAPLKELMAMPDVVKTHSTTRANAENLAPTFLEGLELRFAGTRLGRQELDGELIEDNEAALWRRDWIETARLRSAPDHLIRVVVAVDPPASIAGDECGIVVVGKGEDGDGYVLADWSLAGATPARWAAQVGDVYEHYKADAVIAEANQGGDMVKSTLVEAVPNVPVKLVHATRAKRTRAMPAAALYEQHRIHHIGAFPDLEDQMVSYDGSGKSPDRMDALVWALAELYPVKRGRPRIRGA